MKQFTYRIREDFNLHFGPAGRLAARANCYPDTTATIEVGGRPIKVAVMGIRKDDLVKVTVEGDSEVELIDVLYQFFEEVM